MTGRGNARLRPSANAVWTEVLDVVYIVDAAGEDPFLVRALEGTAAHIWHLLQTAPTEEILVSRISDEYGLAADEVVPEVRRFLDDLRLGGLLAPAS